MSTESVFYLAIAMVICVWIVADAFGHPETPAGPATLHLLYQGQECAAGTPHTYIARSVEHVRSTNVWVVNLDQPTQPCPREQ